MKHTAVRTTAAKAVGGKTIIPASGDQNHVGIEMLNPTNTSGKRPACFA